MSCRPLLRAASVLLAVLGVRTSRAASSQAPPSPAQNTPIRAGPRLAKVDFRDLPLFDACRLLSDQTGLNLVPSEGAREQRVSLYLKDIDAGGAIDGLCRAHQLWFQYSPDTRVVRIHTVDEYKRNLVSFQEDKTEYFTLLYPNALDVGYAIRNLFGDRVVLRTDDTESELLFDLASRFSRFDLIDRRTQGLGQSFSGQNSGGQFFGNDFDGGLGNYGSGVGLGSIGQSRGGLLGNQGAESTTAHDEQEARPRDRRARARARTELARLA